MARDWKTPLQKCMLIPQRGIIAIMCFLSILNAFTMRIFVRVAIIEMVVDREGRSKINAMDASDLHEWNEGTQELIITSFFWGYMITQVPSGIIADKYGGKYPLSIGILFMAFFTLITPMVILLSDWPAFLALRILVGLAEGATDPSINALLSQWVPFKERGIIASFTDTGCLIGVALAQFGGNRIIKASGTWSLPFYVFGCMGVIWVVFFIPLCYSSPLKHPYISAKELAYLDELLGSYQTRDPIPWKAFLSSLPVWALVTAEIGHCWCFYIVISDLPKYMHLALHFSVRQNLLWSTIPYILMWFVSVLTGAFADILMTKNYIGVEFLRKLFTAIGLIGPGLLIVAASYASKNIAIFLPCFLIAMGSMGFYYSGMRENLLDLTKNFAGTLMGLVNGIGTISGLLTPYVVDSITCDSGDIIKWRKVFWINLVVCTVTSLVYIKYASAQLQLWDTPSLYYEQKAADDADKEAARTRRDATNAERASADATFNIDL